MFDRRFYGRARKDCALRPSRRVAPVAAWLAICATAACATDEPNDEPSHGGDAGPARMGPVNGEAGTAATGDAGAAATGDAGLSAAAGLDGGAPEAGPPGSETGRLAGFTDAHNAARSRAVTLMALPALSWSSEIALVAQRYADKLAVGCLDTLMHSTPQERNRWGENLASYSITGGKGTELNGTAERTVALWESELSCYTFGPFQSGVNATCTEACAKYGGCGHLTQLLWRDTQRVGCGVADCTEGKTRKSYWVCNYDPAGNITGDLPY